MIPLEIGLNERNFAVVVTAFRVSGEKKYPMDWNCKA